MIFKIQLNFICTADIQNTSKYNYMFQTLYSRLHTQWNVSPQSLKVQKKSFTVTTYIIGRNMNFSMCTPLIHIWNGG
jgi:hypothetical protein